jgi:hypothetical protein
MLSHAGSTQAALRAHAALRGAALRLRAASGAARASARTQTVCAAKKPDAPGTMRCGVCGQKFTDVAKLEKHFQQLHERERAAKIRHNPKSVFGSGNKPLAAKLRAKEQRFQHVRRRAARKRVAPPLRAVFRCTLR